MEQSYTSSSVSPIPPLASTSSTTSNHDTASEVTYPPLPPSSSSSSSSGSESSCNNEEEEEEEEDSMPELEDLEEGTVETNIPAPTMGAANAAGVNNGIMTDAMVVRMSFVRRIIGSLHDLGRTKRRHLIISTFLTWSQIITFTTMLSLYYTKEQCGQPLGLYLILSIIRLGFGFPLSFYSALVPPRSLRRDTPQQIATRETARRIGTVLIDRRIRRLSDLLSLLSLALFVLGNYWVFTALSSTPLNGFDQHCRTTAPHLIWTVLAGVIISWLYALEVLLIVVAVVFFLPLLLVIMRTFNLGQKSPDVGPLSKAQIKSIPLRIYIPASIPSPKSPTDTHSTIIDSSAPAKVNPDSKDLESALPLTPTQPVANFFRLLRRRVLTKVTPKPRLNDGATKGQVASGEGKENYVKTAGIKFLELTDHQSTCSICLCDYEPPPLVGTSAATGYVPELLRKLHCSHAFHKECLDSWLKVSGRCPLCQSPAIVSKKKKTGEKPGVGITRTTSLATPPETPETAPTATTSQPVSAIPTIIHSADQSNSPVRQDGVETEREGEAQDSLGAADEENSSHSV